MKPIKISAISFALFIVTLSTLTADDSHAKIYVAILCNSMNKNAEISCVAQNTKRTIVLGVDPLSLRPPSVAELMCEYLVSTIIDGLGSDDFSQKAKRALQSGWKLTLREYSQYGYGEIRSQCPL